MSIASAPWQHKARQRGVVQDVVQKLRTSHNVMGICADSPAGFSAQAGVGVLVGWWRAQRDRVDLSTSKLANDECNGAQSLGLPCEIWQTGIRRFIYPLSKYLRKYVTNDIFSGQKSGEIIHVKSMLNLNAAMYSKPSAKHGVRTPLDVFSF